jgi:hypothetical protein
VLTSVNDGGIVYDLGMKFRSSVPGSITAIRFWKAIGESAGHTGRLWSASGTLLGQVSFANETASGWQQATLAQPVSIAAGAIYLVSVNTDSAGNYVATNSGLDTAITSGALTTVADGANGVYIEGASSFPVKSWNNSNYFRDVVFVSVP